MSASVSVASGRPLPWPAMASALVALAAFAVSSGGIVLPLVLGALIVASYFFHNRLPKGSLQLRSIRLIAMGSVVMLRLSESERNGAFAYIDLYVALLGQLSAIELALQFWQWPPWAGERGAIVICLSGLVFVAAAKTEDRLWIQYFTPVYVVFLILALHAVRVRVSRQATFRSAGAIVALCAVFMLGAGVSSGIRHWGSELTAWFTRLIMPQGVNEYALGIPQNAVLGQTSNLRLSPGRVLRIEGELREHHFRGIAFDTYQRGQWGPALDKRGPEYKMASALQLNAGADFNRLKNSAGASLTVTRLIAQLRVVVAPLHCQGVSAPQPIEWIPDEGGPLKPFSQAGGAVPPATYQVLLSNEPDYQGPLCVPPPPEYRARCVYVPFEISPRVHELAAQIVGTERDPRKRAELIAAYLRTHHEYSRTTNPGPGDQISNFLIEKKAAHCEYFASAAVMLLRCSGIPARYVSGYYAHDSSPDGVTIVRQFDGHAWAECYIDGRGWITVDATPKEGLPDAAAQEVPWSTTLWEYLEDKWDALRDWLAQLGLLQQAATVLIVAVFVLFLQWLRAFRSSRKAPREIVFAYSTPSAGQAGLTDLAARFENLLRAKGIPCPPHRTWAEHLAQLPTGAGRTLNIAEAAEFARLYARIRFGAGDAAGITELNRRLQALAVGRETSRI